MRYTQERQNLWIALSELYVDNEIQDYDIKQIAKAIIDGGFSLEEAKKINRGEVFPVLKTNLMSVAGVWTGFDEKWLVQAISRYLHRRIIFLRFPNIVIYFMMKGLFKDQWRRIENEISTTND